jgi:hypothetical protein
MNDMSDGRANSAWGPAVQLARLERGMDQLIKDFATQDKKIDLLAQKVDGLEDRLEKIEARASILPTSPQQPITSWLVTTAILIFAVVAILVMANLR